ncbi:hypothetical protein PR202_gb22669 [Eleusine coracana subsp. coracana]|uniref:TCP domain-containing protein n=1 Tax=Eleusine coracana subsp. coracana TaxID=191504 RepID=A0AAV5FIE7_ELECO|nr:hypothetical protein QOZ80_6AG0534840 [Eleusine coracana subsp. coracana]GJN34036.1 hypothetical protein PR202_gb22669 [Eleusine coracana subsp. coracana]
MAAHPDQHHYDHFFPGHGHGQQGQYFNSEMLEAVLIRPPPRAGAAAAAAAPESRDHHHHHQAILPAPQQGMARAGQAGGGARARKRPFRTDRHSKIRTAQGVRDRRMRLSLDVARDFFALQDRLGFDKASKTVDWLLTQSKPAIDRLSDEPAASSHHHHRRGDAAAMSSSPMSAEAVAKETAAAGSGGAGGAEKAATSRHGSTVFMDHGFELDRLVAAAPVLGEYYYEFGEMMSSNNNNGGEAEDDDGDYDEDGDFLDGMQY